jgi:Ni,Fe-hydrogenase III large subunit
MYREASSGATQLGHVVAQTCHTHEPLGAYATSERVNYLFLDRDGVLNITSERSATGTCSSSVASEYPLLDWDEREMRDTYGVGLSGLPNARPLFITDNVVPPALTAEGKGVTVVVVGPVHAGIIEPGRFTISSGGESVIHMDAQLSYSRRGVERFLEGQSALEAASRVSRICAACSVARSWAYARALEHLSGIACDEASEWARVVVAELERIYNHVFDLASSAAGAGYGYGQTHGLALKERVHELCAATSGHRMLFDAIVPGGIRSGVLSDPEALCAKVAALRDDVDTYVQALFRNASVVRRFEGAGYVSPETARAFGAVGPARRASGGTIDIRSYLPYGAYREHPPARHGEAGGDVAARCNVKRVELAESFTLIDHALRAMSGYGPPPPQPFQASAGVVTTLVEGPRGAESISVECDRRGMLTRIHVISASYRNWPVVLRAMEGNIIPDFPLVNKSFNLCYACADR